MNPLEILEMLCRQPTVSFHEGRVARVITSICSDSGLNPQVDQWGNIIVDLMGDDDANAIATAYVAHMDHPGFEALGKNENGTISAVSHGGMAPASLQPGTRLKIVQGSSERVDAEIISSEDLRTSPDGRFASAKSIKIKASEDVRQFPAPVILDLPDFELDGEMIRARSIDDLAGCATIIHSLTQTARSQSNAGRVMGIFTRAEEVGLVGARLIAQDRLVPREAAVFSIETSLKSTEAQQGGGVVIRVGDRATTFDDAAEQILRASADRLQARESENFKARRALMGAGGCEASAFAAHGYSVSGTSYPLGAWHNREDDGSISLEYIHIDDFHSGVALITEAMGGGVAEREEPTSSGLSGFPEADAKRLRETLNL